MCDPVLGNLVHAFDITVTPPPQWYARLLLPCPLSSLCYMTIGGVNYSQHGRHDMSL